MTSNLKVRWRFPAVALAAAIATAAVTSGPAMAWTRVASVPTESIYSVSLSGTTVYAGSANRVYVGANDGSTWSESAVIHPEGAGVEAVLPAGGALWAGLYGHGVFRSTDGGASWGPVNTGLTGLGALAIIDFAARGGKLYAATLGAGVFELDLATQTGWTAFDAGYPISISGNVTSMILSGNNLVAAAGGNGFVYLYPAGGAQWQEIAVMPPSTPGMLPFDLADNSGFLLMSSTQRVHRSGNNGATWTFAGTGLPTNAEISLASNGSIFYAAATFFNNSYVVYRTTDAGASWQPFGDGASAYLYDLTVAGGQLLAAREDGLWSTPVETSGIGDTPAPGRSHLRLAQNAPNPVQGRTLIEIEIPGQGEVSLHVFDPAGRRVATLLNDGFLEAGRHQIVFQAPDHLPNGLYMYQLRSGANVLSRKLAIVR